MYSWEKIFLVTLSNSLIFRIIKQILEKNFTPWKLGSIKKSKFLFRVCCVTLDWYLFQLIVHLEPHCFNCFNRFTLSWFDKVRTVIYSFVSVILNVSYWFAVVPATKKQFFDQINIRLTSQLMAFQVFSKYCIDILMKPLFQHFFCHYFLFSLLFLLYIWTKHYYCYQQENQ